MWNSLLNCFDRDLPKRYSRTIYRDELNEKPTPKEEKKGDCLGNKQPLLCKGQGDENHNQLKGGSCIVNEEKRVIRVKVKMTKQEAAKLMSRCKDGGVLGFKDVADELMQIPLHRVSVVSCSGGGYGGALDSIPEEQSIGSACRTN